MHLPKKRWIGIVCMAILFLIVFSSVMYKTFSTAHADTNGHVVNNIGIRFYSWVDNTPPNTHTIAYPNPEFSTTIHVGAGGTGSYTDPITFSTSLNNPQFPVGSIIYIAHFQKYFVMEDNCRDCSMTQIRVWINGNDTSAPATAAIGTLLAQCMQSLGTFSTDILSNPGLPTSETVDPNPLFDAANGTCNVHSTEMGNVNGTPGPTLMPTPTITVPDLVNNPSTNSVTLSPATINTSVDPSNPDFGSNVIIFDPSMSSSTIQNQLDSIFSKQESSEFGTDRYALLFKPGLYNVKVNLGFYMQVLGLGEVPDGVTINGDVGVNANWMGGNATLNFWRGAENMKVIPSSGTEEWAVSQADPFRRMDVQGSMVLAENGGWASGGFIADSNVTGQVDSASQQQWISRNDQFGSWSGSNWNMVFVGVKNAPTGTYPSPAYTVVNQTPVIHEKPFLYINQSGQYQVFVPGLSTNSQGTDWAAGTQVGTSLPLNYFYIAKPSDTASSINAALAQGMNLLFTPGIYHLSDTIHVTRPGTVVLGIGMATLTSQNGVIPMMVDDIDGVSIAGLLFDAGPQNSSALLQIGATGASQDHALNPTTLSDVFFRIGGAGVGKVSQSLIINSKSVITDDMWIWRADHGDGVGWTDNTSDNGLIVNGDNVTAYGLFVEHFQKQSVIWNGNGGRTYFFQNEFPYDPPDQASWMNGSVDGYPAYEVAPTVTTHEAWGLGSYCNFNVNSSVVVDHAFEAPQAPSIKFHDLVTVSLGGAGTITHIINGVGGPSDGGESVARLVNYP